MKYRSAILVCILVFLVVAETLTNQECYARGFGGARGGMGGMSRGAMGGMPRGGMGGFNPGNFGGMSRAGMGGFIPGNFGGMSRAGMGGFNPGSFGGMSRAGMGGLNAGGLGGIAHEGLTGGMGGLGGLAGNGNFNRSALGATGLNGGVSRAQLSSFLGLPSDEGLHRLGASSAGFGNGMDVNRAAVEGPRGGVAAGATVTGPRGNTVGRGAAVGPNGAAVAGRGVAGEAGGAAMQGVGIGPRGEHVAGFSRVAPADRYMAGSAIRRNFDRYGMYRRGWYGEHPGAWMALLWEEGYCWRIANQEAIWEWLAWSNESPMYYDYGNNVNIQPDGVFVNGDNVASTEQYYAQAETLANSGAQATAPADGDWLPLGVFALTKDGKAKSDVTIQLAVNKQGVVRGNYTDIDTDKTQLIQGSVDKQTQRLAFSVGDNKTNIVETGIYNLTKDEAPIIIHFGKERTEQWMLVRLKDQTTK